MAQVPVATSTSREGVADFLFHLNRVFRFFETFLASVPDDVFHVFQLQLRAVPDGFVLLRREDLIHRAVKLVDAMGGE